MSAKRKVRARKRQEPFMRLYEAVASYVKANGGTVVVAGGIDVIQWPLDPDSKFTVGIRCLGRKPVFAKVRPATTRK